MPLTRCQAPALAWRSPLYPRPDQIDRLGGAHPQPVALWPAEADIGAGFRQPDAADALTRRIPYRHTHVTGHRGRAGPDIAGHVHPVAVRSAMDAVHIAIGELALVGDLVAHNVGDIDAGAPDEVDFRVVGREGDAIGHEARTAFQDHVQPSARVPAIDAGRAHLFARPDDAGAAIADIAV